MNAHQYILRKIQLIGNTKFISLPPNKSLNKGDQMVIIAKDEVHIIVPLNMYNGLLKSKIEEFFAQELSEVI